MATLQDSRTPRGPAVGGEHDALTMAGRLADYLRRLRGTRFTASEYTRTGKQLAAVIAEATGERCDDARVRELVWTARAELHEPIASDSRGYWYALDHHELEAYTEIHRSRIAKMSAAHEGAYRKFKESEQLRMDI